jgi:alcohol dehydrogenase class IV
MAERDFTWHDAERTIVFRPGALADSTDILAGTVWERFEVLTTTRALGAAPVDLAERASMVHQVGPGEVPDVAAAIIDRVRNPTLVALGGGRVIDTAKAIAALRGGRVCAIPTTLSGAEMTEIHRFPAGREVYARHHVRPKLVIADPLEMTTLDDRRLRASAMNALGHGAEALYVPFANPVGTLAALRGAELIASALDQPPGDRDRGGAALGSILCAYALDSTGFALHHVVCQTLVRMVGTPHADTNATMLPRTMDAMRGRAPEEIASLAHALGVEPDEIRSRIESLGGGPRRLGDVGGNPDRVEAACQAMLERPELANTPDPPGLAELRRLVEDGW